MNKNQEFRIYQILETKLEEIAKSVGYYEYPEDSPEYGLCLKTWRDYLKDLRITVSSKPDFQFFAEDKKNYLTRDPLYLTGDWLVIPMDVVDKILAIGLP